MFGLFESKPFGDAKLGELRRSGGYWKARIILHPCGTFRLALSGNRQAPAPGALQVARELPERFQPMMPDIQSGLFEHYEPYRQAVESGEYAGSRCPDIGRAEEVWPYVTPAHVLIESADDGWRIEIAVTTAWDIEHTVAAIFVDGRFIELNGSVRGQ